MGSRNSKTPKGSKVGYGRPPDHTKFKPGQSGNPNGRPKGSRNLKTIVKQVFDEPLQVQENGKTRRLPAIEVLIRSLRKRAFNGDHRAVAATIMLWRQTGYGMDGSEVAAAPLGDQELTDFLKHYLDRQKPQPLADTDKPNAVRIKRVIVKKGGSDT